MRRFTFVVQVHPEGVTTVENLSTQERVSVGDLDEVGPRIESWLEEVSPRPNRAEAPTEPAPG